MTQFGVRPWMGNPKFSPPKRMIVIPPLPPVYKELAEIAAEVARKHGLRTWGEMKRRRRGAEIVTVRSEFWFRASTETKNSLSEIGRFLGFDHASVIRGIKRYREKSSGEAQQVADEKG